MLWRAPVVLVLPIVVIAGTACLACSHSSNGGDAGPVCGVGFLGDAAAPVELVATSLGADGGSSVLADGGTVALIFPPQGGRVIFAGVRANNIDPCAVQLLGALRDLQNSEVRIDQRTVNLVPAPDGWGTSVDSDISTFANVPVCPNLWSATNTYGNPYDLVVQVTDHEGRQASQTLQVTLACAEPDKLAECLCICKQGYVLGQACPADGGAE